MRLIYRENWEARVGRWYLDHVRYHFPQGTMGRLTHLPGWVVEIGRQDTDTEEKRRKLVEVVKGSKPLLVIVEALGGDPKEHEEVTKKLFDMQVAGSRYGLSVEAPGRNTYTGQISKCRGQDECPEDCRGV